VWQGATCCHGDRGTSYDVVMAAFASVVLGAIHDVMVKNVCFTVMAEVGMCSKPKAFPVFDRLYLLPEAKTSKQMVDAYLK